jgi:1,2-phenylacetyl-CoA epoxidase PaaB subunit
MQKGSCASVQHTVGAIMRRMGSRSLWKRRSHKVARLDQSNRSNWTNKNLHPGTTLVPPYGMNRIFVPQ